jgi:diacylglycerol kinase family enzyme
MRQQVSTASQVETAVLPPQIAFRSSQEARNVIISANPRAGSRSRHAHIESFASVLTNAGYKVQLLTNLDELAGLSAEQAKTGELRAVVAVGGDGTASIVRTHVPLKVPLLPVPMGTENLLGRFVSQATDPAAVRRTLDEGVTVGLDLGRANGKLFLLMISAGFDAEVVRSLHMNRRGNITRAAYFLPMVRAIRSYRYPQMKLYCGDKSASVAPLQCRWLFAFNLPLYALGLPIAPDALATDGLLDVCTFERGSTWSVLRYLWHVRRGCHLALPDAALRRCSNFRLEGPNSVELAYQVDGEYGGTLPVDVELLPGELRLLVTPETAARLGFEIR